MTTSTITLPNGTMLPTISAWSRTGFFQAADRQLLEIHIPSSVITFDALRALFTGENLGELLITETTIYEPETTETGEVVERDPTVNKYLHLNYTLVKELGLRELEGMFFIVLAQKTALELAQEELAVMVAEQQDALIELAAIIG